MYNIFTVEVKIPSQQGAAQFGGITRFVSLLGLDELPHQAYPQLHGHKLLLIVRVSMEDGACQCKPKFVFYTAGVLGLVAS